MLKKETIHVDSSKLKTNRGREQKRKILSGLLASIKMPDTFLFFDL